MVVTNLSALLLQQRIDILDILQRVVDKELQLGNNLNLEAHTTTKRTTNQLILLLDNIECSLRLVEWEYANVDLGITQVGRYTHRSYGDKCTTQRLCYVTLKNLSYVALNLLCNLLLSCILAGRCRGEESAFRRIL